MSPTDDLRLLAELCDAAVALYGADIRRIEAHVEEEISKLPDVRRSALRNRIAEFLRSQRALIKGGLPSTLN